MDLNNLNLKERITYLEMKDRHKKILIPWYKKWWGITILIIIALLLIAISAMGFYVYNQAVKINQEKAAGVTDLTAATTLAINGPGNDYYLGPKNARLTIIEFGDFACPYCQASYQIVNDIAQKYPTQVKIVFRDLPLHSNSSQLALAARCAGEQGRFWEMYNQLFSNQVSLTASSEDDTTLLEGLAAKIGLKKSQYDQCFQNKKYLNSIAVDFQDAQSLNIQGTPTWFFNNKMVTGAIPEDGFIQIINNLLTIYK